MIRLLIADDSDILRSRLAEILAEIKGVEIIGEAKDSKEVVDLARNLNPDAVILDIRMPGGNGISALETLKKEENPPIVIIFTNYPYLQYRKRCLDSGADYFFYKAIEFEKLLNLVRDISKSKIQPNR